jgi:hypothetical protein
MISSKRLLDRNVRRLGAAQDLGGESRHLTEDSSESRAVGQQASFFGDFRPFVDGRQLQALKLSNDDNALG